jgi:TfoX/Sxy family transcriptional regulator of competence genes
MAGKKESGIAPERIAIYDSFIENLEGIERKGATMPYTSMNGHMFSFLAADGSLALRLPADEREQFIKRHKAALCEAHGTVLKEYVAVPEKLLKNTKAMQEYFSISYEYVRNLKPKSTTKKKK